MAASIMMNTKERAQNGKRKERPCMKKKISLAAAFALLAVTLCAAAIEYSVTDREAFDGTQGGLWFEFIDPQKEGEPWEQRLAAGLTGSGSAGAVDPQEEEPVQFCQRETLGRNELHEVYTLRAFDAWEKGRYETHEIRMRPATAEDMEK